MVPFEMNNLSTYVSTIKNTSESEFVVKRSVNEESIEEDGIVTKHSEEVITFKNGVVTKQSIENEIGAADLEMACEECFITYEVLSEPVGYCIKPKRKNFINNCQERF